ncbi:envelope biogenesis lipoprotein LpqN [Mycobacterium montefiorense]|uniref:Lipoprotein LpqN n=1 Tax=Mycobacterium montefiorense TaxID=154654 RepID=A0AA37UX38_9MYCO|nr:LpqN/LpqT family lipoprotein [Mycobacterium montefiorense]MCV7428787.1 LpqN/LpqT family lipoprotein [Mycobacterium montefiorense]GBG40688.1 hypothetical protein MmonteBS_50600 [Mycobacterium montefiorense]GKU33331.1 hypothetical protein NJB14191_06780 [Mycobacterium montefiorense]GKU41741.1 hypothetical protein NJB14192_37250 [Mycobacterium montefiorense]GKU44871.1 hypothetical protein NJB14194_14950 [Mycobacterium montefiorense]
MKHFTAATIVVALSLAVVGCGSGGKSETKTSTSTSTSTSTTTTTTTTSATPGAHANKSIADYVVENKITETPVHRGDPGPTINLPVPPGWQIAQNSAASYGAIVQSQPANPADPPTIVAIFSKLTGNVDPAKILHYAPGELQNLPGYEGSKGNASTLGGFQAWQLGGTYTRDGKTRAIAQKTVVIPSQDGVYVLQFNADSLQSDHDPLNEATNVIDDQTTITP